MPSLLVRTAASMVALAPLSFVPPPPAAAPGNDFGSFDYRGPDNINSGSGFRGLADVNGDGRADYCRLVGSTLRCMLAGEAAFGADSISSAATLDAGYPSFRAMADVNGDGRADYCRFVGGGAGGPAVFLSCALSTGRGFGQYDFNAPSSVAGSADFQALADADGDGRADFCRLVGTGSTRMLSCVLAGATSFGPATFNSAAGFDAGYATFRGMADVNGDSQADYCRFVGGGAGAPPVFLSCALARNGRFGSYDLNSPGNLDQGTATYRGLADVNGDDRADYCRFASTATPSWLACTLAGDSTFGPGEFTSPAGYDAGYDTFRGMADVKGNGRAGYCRFVGGPGPIWLGCGLPRGYWELEALVNDTWATVAISVPVPLARVARGSALNARGTMGIAIAQYGVVELRETGATGCASPRWGVAASFQTGGITARSWRYYFDGIGSLRVAVAADTTVSLAPGARGGQVVSGTAPPVCAGGGR